MENAHRYANLEWSCRQIGGRYQVAVLLRQDEDSYARGVGWFDPCGDRESDMESLVWAIGSAHRMLCDLLSKAEPAAGEQRSA